MKSRFAFIDALRGFASLGVVLFHAVEGRHVEQLPAWVLSIAYYGNLGVPVFFVISGFVISHALRGPEMTPGKLVRFMARRSIRLDPPYWAAIIITIGFSLAASRLVPGRVAETYSASQIAAHLFYLQTILDFKQVNPVFWTLTYEIQFYLVFGLLLLSRSRPAMVVAFLVGLPWAFGIGGDTHGIFLNLWFGFLLGVAAYWSLREPRYRAYFFAYSLTVLSACVVRGDLFGATCALSALMIFWLGIVDRLNLFETSRSVQLLGAISYSLYLVHNPVTGAVFRAGYRITSETPGTEMIWWLVSIIASVTAALGLYRLVELPCTKLAKTHSETRPVIDTV